MIQSRVRTYLVRTSYPGQRVRQAMQRLQTRVLLRHTEKVHPPPPPAEPPLSSAMNYWLQTIGENKGRLDRLCQDMGTVKVELDSMRTSLRKGLGKMQKMVQRDIGEASTSDIQEYGNIITVDTIRLRAPNMSPLAHEKGIQEADDMRMEAVNERWLYDPWSGQRFFSGVVVTQQRQL